MAERFHNAVSTLVNQDTVQDREVALIHPDLSSYIRLLDNGDIEITSTDGLGIILNRAQKAIILTGDTIKFMTRITDGLRWNDLSFNHKAITFNEPTFMQVIDTDAQHTFKGTNQFYGSTS